MFSSPQNEAQSGSPAASGLPPAYDQALWYAVYTAPRHEKSVARQMDGSGVDHFLPLYRSVHRWKDRRMEVELPLFPGYVFVHMAFENRLQVLRLPGVVHLVCFNGKPAALPENEIEALRTGLSRSGWVEPHPYLKIGRRVRVRSGPVAGVIGILVRRKDKFRVVLSVDLIKQAVALEVDMADVEPVASA